VGGLTRGYEKGSVKDSGAEDRQGGIERHDAKPRSDCGHRQVLKEGSFGSDREVCLCRQACLDLAGEEVSLGPIRGRRANLIRQRVEALARVGR
jgi:hypothetical protein